MSLFALEPLTDFGDYSGGDRLSETLRHGFESRLSRVRLSPDGRHIHVREPEVGLVTFDKYERAQPVHNQKNLCVTRSHSIVDVLYLNSDSKKYVVLVVYENGKAEFWRFQECQGGWSILQTSELCNSPRARLLSVCVCSNLIIWCEERPPSESSTTNKLRYCVCRREYAIQEGAVSLGRVKITLHNNPKFTVVSSGECVHLLPDASAKPQLSVSRCLLAWYPRQDVFHIGTTGRTVPLKKVTGKESDFQKLVLDCLGYLSAVDPPDICGYASLPCGELLLLLGTGWVCHLQKDGTLRRVHELADNGTLESSSLAVFKDTLALVASDLLLLIDLNCGRELGKVLLPRKGVLFTNQSACRTPHLLSETGLYALVQRDADNRDSKMKSSVEHLHPGALLVEAVFEEACKYYQQRSLSSTQLTVEALKRGGRFQAPISLASILRVYLNLASPAEPVQNGSSGFNDGHDKLQCSLEAELKALVSLEEVKRTLVRGGEAEVEAVCESLVEEEVMRLLSVSEMDKDNLLYLNSIFSGFPCQAWRAAQRTLQLHYNGEGVLSARAPADVWKTILSPTGTSAPLTNGGPKHTYHNAKCSHPALPSVMPVFELLCCSVLHFQPTWLPRFLELAQQQQGSAALGLSLVSSSWSMSNTTGEEAPENKVPLYKRTLCVLNSHDADQHQDLEVEVMMTSGRPVAILEALRILIRRQQWERVIQMAQKFCKQSPFLNKDIFTSLLCEVTQHRDLDSYLDLLWTLCPEDMTVTTLLNFILKNLPSPVTAPPTPFSASSSTAPFPDPQSGRLTIGLLKPLLRKVLQREMKPSQHYADILQSPSFPPPTPPRQPAEQTPAHPPDRSTSPESDEQQDSTQNKSSSHMNSNFSS
ncbi:BLOC-2 complex member HPS6 [Neosynchiropus ocellatus]